MEIQKSSKPIEYYDGEFKIVCIKQDRLVKSDIYYACYRLNPTQTEIPANKKPDFYISGSQLSKEFNKKIKQIKL